MLSFWQYRFALVVSALYENGRGLCSKMYASLYFCCAVEQVDNELLTLEVIHRYVELLDKYFGSVCELDIIFNFEKAYFILDELLVGGEMQETSKKNVLKAIAAQDLLQEYRRASYVSCTWVSWTSPLDDQCQDHAAAAGLEFRTFTTSRGRWDPPSTYRICATFSSEDGSRNVMNNNAARMFQG
ncbi:hypothetical protein HPB51_023008 [Rhipicephalus microplus]|uniref:AP complex mu/sigma subunit domain-containing protein n=1 Tax=Rhipicephalus microplus TaxID=6941 RepID=A0A9J6D7B6_RHIMP|nr:hypothetical protein HPB51_023008 [Rhipicephalus microplus]